MELYLDLYAYSHCRIRQLCNHKRYANIQMLFKTHLYMHAMMVVLRIHNEQTHNYECTIQLNVKNINKASHKYSLLQYFKTTLILARYSR